MAGQWLVASSANAFITLLNCLFTVLLIVHLLITSGFFLIIIYYFIYDYLLLHSSAKEVHIDLPQFSWWPWVTDPDLAPGSCQFCQIVLTTKWPDLKGPQKIRVVFMCTSFREECTCISISFRLGRKGRTIIFSIHQPRFSIFRLFDRLSLLCFGNMVYHGPASEAIDYFASIGMHNLLIPSCKPMSKF